MGRTAKPWFRSFDGWWYSTIAGQRRRLAKGEKSKAEATKEFYRLKANEEAEAERKAVFSLVVLADTFLVSIEKTHEPETRDAYLDRVKKFVAYVGPDTLADKVKPFQITKWLDSHPAWGATTRSTLGKTIKRMFAYAFEQGYLATNPVMGFKPEASRRRAEVLTSEQADKVFESATSGNFRDLLTALRETGCRPKEVYTLTADRVDLEARTWMVLDKIRKRTGETYRVVYLTPAIAELSRRLLAAHPEGLVFRNRHGRAWTKVTVSWRFRKLQKSLGYGAECTPYSYRHLYITDALERGVNPATLATLVGHSDLKMIMKFYNRLSERTGHLRDAANAARSISAASRPVEQPGEPA